MCVDFSLGGGSPVWFGTVYIDMLLLTPFMNACLSNLKRTKMLLIVLFVINSIPSTFLFRNDFFFSGEIVWFCFLYLLMGYIKRTGMENSISRKTSLYMTIGAYLFLLLVYFGTEYLSSMNAQFASVNTVLELSTYYINRYHTLPSFVCSLSVFFLFEKTKMRYNKTINEISKGCFGVYILHQAPGFTKFMWQEIFKTQEWLYSTNYILYYLGTVLSIFAIGSGIDLIRRKCIENSICSSSLVKSINERLEKFYLGF